MGTPHQGGNKASLGSIAGRIATALLGNPANDLMESLVKNSLLREGSSNYFRHQLEDYYIISFYESLNYKVKGRSIGRVRSVDT